MRKRQSSYLSRVSVFNKLIGLVDELRVSYFASLSGCICYRDSVKPIRPIYKHVNKTSDLIRGSSRLESHSGARCHRLSLPGGLSLPEAAITIAGTNPNPEP